ncbi:MAG TPA: heme-binding domain-containing protein [Thermomicrobiaceae bacterium]|nr:heme-binding domain-containing protein [Thermomicrobiaceae bacterium]
MFRSPYLQRKWLPRWAAMAVLLFAAIQLVPFGHGHSAPPVVHEPVWNTPQTRQLAVDACYDCHSNQTQWPWYSNVAPISWLNQLDVTLGRRALNFSDWNAHPISASRIDRSIQRGSMPPFFYTPLHRSAQLTAAQKQQLIQGIEASLGASGSNP